MLRSCREGSPYGYLLQIFEVFQRVVLYIQDISCSPLYLYCWRNRWWHRHQDALCKVLAQEALELDHRRNVVKLIHSERKIRFWGEIKTGKEEMGLVRSSKTIMEGRARRWPESNCFPLIIENIAKVIRHRKTVIWQVGSNRGMIYNP